VFCFANHCPGLTTLQNQQQRHLKYSTSQQNDIQAREKSKIELLGGLCHTMVDIRSSVSNMMESLNWPKLESRQRVSRLQTVNKGVNKLPVYLYHPTFYPHNIQLDLIFQI